MHTDYFPQGIAKGKAFIGRQEESASLTYNIEHGHHTLLVAPRRFGKTSLAQHALSKLKLPSAEANFFLAKTEHAVQAKILDAVEKILSQVVPQQENLIAKIARYFSKSKTNWTFGIKGLASVQLTPARENDVSESLFTALSLAEDILTKEKKKAVLYLDEIQQIHLLKGGFTLQGAIREFAQISKHIIFIFSGSNRRILHNMFDNKAMPMYELCERIRLDRISTDDYKNYLNKVANKSFGKSITDKDIDLILTLTQRHPKRVYNLCYQIWKEANNEITSLLIKKTWDKFIESRLTDSRMHLSQLNVGQLKLLTLIASGKNKTLTGKAVQEQLNITSPTIVAALQQLVENDYIEQNSDSSYRLIDPLIQEVLLKYESDNI
ncbi:MAG: ATP-binding protein [Coxiellaceae bacterium]|nr:ATP-binding protein [Coxiellaceae bacterium]